MIVNNYIMQVYKLYNKKKIQIKKKYIFKTIKK